MFEFYADLKLVKLSISGFGRMFLKEGMIEEESDAV
jgi:hypothetical protein